MSYLVLARKWRPQSFEEIRGQQHVARALRNAIASGRIAHAYLFTGIRGVGKTSAARILARALNCTTGPTPTPCNRCEACREITAGKSADVLEIDGASHTGVEDVRKLREAVRYPPVAGAYRIYIIDEVHMLSTAAFNALLKTLEEPPAHAVFILATTDPHKVPVTILSRCQQFDFKRLAPRELTALLADIARAESIAVDDKSLAALAREADGSVRDAQSLLDQVISYAGQTVTYADVRDVLGVVDRDLLLNLAQAVIGRDPRRVLTELAEAERFGYDARRLAYDLMDVFRDLSVLKAVEDGHDLVELAVEEVEAARKMLGAVSWEDVHALFDMLSRGVEGLRSASRPGVVLEMTLLKMAKLPPVLPISEILARVESGPSGAGRSPGTPRPAVLPAAPAPTRSASPADPSGAAAGMVMEPPAPPLRRAPPSEPAAAVLAGPSAALARQPEEVEVQEQAAASPPRRIAASAGPQEVWANLLAEVMEGHRPFWTVLKDHVRLASWDPVQSVAVLTYDDPGHEFFLRQKMDVLNQMLRKLAGPEARVELRCEGRGGGSRNDVVDESERARGVRRDVMRHPRVLEAVEIFDGNVDEIRILKPE